MSLNSSPALRTVLRPALPALRRIRSRAKSFGGDTADVRRMISDEVDARNEAMTILNVTVSRLRDQVEALEARLDQN